MLAFWDTFGEIFGMPMRIARTTSRDQKEIDRLDKMLREAGTALSMVAGMETEIEFVESGKGDAFNVYDKRIDRANSELSKLIIGQTMTIEDGSSLSQSETHLEVFQNLVESDCDMARYIEYKNKTQEKCNYCTIYQCISGFYKKNVELHLLLILAIDSVIYSFYVTILLCKKAPVFD